MGPGEALARWREGLPKLWLLDRLLDLRNKWTSLFECGSYEPVEVQGSQAEHVVAFCRTRGSQNVIVAAPRLALRHIDTGQPAWIKANAFAGTRIRLPAKVSRYSEMTGLVFENEGDEVTVSQLWREFPVAILYSDGAPSR